MLILNWKTRNPGQRSPEVQNRSIDDSKKDLKIKICELKPYILDKGQWELYK